MMLSKIASKLNDHQIAKIVAIEIRSILFLSIRSKEKPECWCLTLQQHLYLIVNCLIALTCQYNIKELFEILFSCLVEIEYGKKSFFVPSTNVLFANHKKCPFDEEKRDPEFISKVRGVLLHFCSHATEEIALNILNIVPSTLTSNENKCFLCETTLVQYLTQTKEKNPRLKVASVIEFPDNHDLYSKNLNSLLTKCVETHSALTLTCLIQKILKQSNQTATLIYLMDFILKFQPSQYRDFDMIYLYYIACEIIEFNQWDLSNPSIQEKTMKLEQTLTYYGSIHTNDGWTKKITQFSIGNDFNNIKITPATSLACRAVHVFVGQILSVRN